MSLTTEDVLEIQQLAARYFYAVDSADADGFAELFTPDGQLRSSRLPDPIVGRAALAEFVVEPARRSLDTRHMLSNVVVEGDGDTAALRAYVQTYGRPGGGPRRLLASGMYSDTLQRVGGKWLFAARSYTHDPD